MKKVKQTKLDSFKFENKTPAFLFDLEKRTNMYLLGLWIEEKKDAEKLFREQELEKRNIRYNQNRAEKRKMNRRNQEEVGKEEEEVIYGAAEHKDNVCDNNMVSEILSSDEDNHKPKNSTKKFNKKIQKQTSSRLLDWNC